MKLNKSKFLVLGLILALSVAPMTVSAAGTNLQDSTSSSATDHTAGSDTTQDKKTEYANGNITSTTHTSTSTVTLYATKASYVSYEIPQVLIGSSTSSEYTVGAKGSLSSYQTLKAVAPANFNISDGEKTVPVTITQAETTWTDDNIGSTDYTRLKGTLKYTLPVSGSYSGTFNIDISLVSSK